MNDENRKAMWANKKNKSINSSELNQIVKTKTNTRVNEDYGKIIAFGYEELKNKPRDKKVKEAYDVFIRETLQQAKDIKKSGIIFEPTDKDMYQTENEMVNDVKNNHHIYYRPSEDDYKGIEDNPLYAMTDFTNVFGQKMRANDLFRVVHDINGHAKAHHATFTPEGEQKAFVEHKKMYSAGAIRALFTETQGQGNWLNFNKKTGKQNRHFQDIGELDKLKFPKQKAGLFPDEVVF